MLIHAPTAVVRERVGPWGTLEDAGSGRCRFTMASDSLDWPTLALGNAAAEFEVLSPVELVDHLRERADLSDAPWSETVGLRTAILGRTGASSLPNSGVTGVMGYPMG